MIVEKYIKELILTEDFYTKYCHERIIIHQNKQPLHYVLHCTFLMKKVRI